MSNILFLNFVTKKIYSYLVHYPTPLNFNYMYNFGSLAGLFLVVQIVTGFILTMFYTPHIDYAFDSVEHLMRDVSYGWFIRYLHANGASFFFIVVYIHILRGIYYGSYNNPRLLVWLSGCLIYVLLMGAAFLGYVLPWGQMSYWAATVITNFLTVIPFVGKDIVYWVWGGYSINNATLNRFFSLHYILPFAIAVISVYHIYILHKSGSSNPLGIKASRIDKIPFYPYFILKDLYGILVTLIFFSYIVFFSPEIFNHADNYIRANPLVTPPHIVPEWYVLPLYGILRSILDKTFGIIIMGISIICIFLLPYLDFSIIKGKVFKLSQRTFFWAFVFNFAYLGYLGSQTPSYPFIELGVLCTHLHLLYFFLFIPVLNFYYILVDFEQTDLLLNIKMKNASVSSNTNNKANDLLSFIILSVSFVCGSVLYLLFIYLSLYTVELFI
jgi:quinol-cytochrome oxidoreductase complex cytochrome b subunit